MLPANNTNPFGANQYSVLNTHQSISIPSRKPLDLEEGDQEIEIIINSNNI
jgi:hypothetical protein